MKRVVAVLILTLGLLMAFTTAKPARGFEVLDFGFGGGYPFCTSPLGAPLPVIDASINGQPVSSSIATGAPEFSWISPAYYNTDVVLRLSADESQNSGDSWCFDEPHIDDVEWTTIISWSAFLPYETVTPCLGTRWCDIKEAREGVYEVFYAASDEFFRRDDHEIVFVVDKTPPTVTCAVSPVFLLNQSGATVSATVADALSLPAAPTVTTSADTRTVGLHTVSLTGKDRAGNATTVACPYTVVYKWTGFLSPVNATNRISATAGSSVPLKWQLQDAAGASITSLTSVAGVKSAALPCDGGPAGSPTRASSAGGSGVRYDSTANQYVFSWQTDPTWSGSCRRFLVTLDDGTTHTADFQFR